MSHVSLEYDSTANVLLLTVYDGWLLAEFMAISPQICAIYDEALTPVPIFLIFETDSIPADLTRNIVETFSFDFYTHPNAGPAYFVDPAPIGKVILNLIRAIKPSAIHRFHVVESLEAAYTATGARHHTPC